MSDEDVGVGVKTLVERMKTHPHEFFSGNDDKWRFIYKETFKDVLTELEKGMLHKALREVRRHELDVTVMRSLLEAEESSAAQETPQKASERARLTSGGIYQGGFGQAQIKPEGAALNQSYLGTRAKSK